MKKLIISILLFLPLMSVQAQSVLTPQQQLEEAQKKLEEAKKAVEEAKQILKTRPQQLSLQEMYLVAQTMKAGRLNSTRCSTLPCVVPQ